MLNIIQSAARNVGVEQNRLVQQSNYPLPTYLLRRLGDLDPTQNIEPFNYYFCRKSNHGYSRYMAIQQIERDSILHKGLDNKLYFGRLGEGGSLILIQKGILQLQVFHKIVNLSRPQSPLVTISSLRIRIIVESNDEDTNKEVPKGVYVHIVRKDIGKEGLDLIIVKQYLIPNTTQQILKNKEAKEKRIA